MEASSQVWFFLSDDPNLCEVDIELANMGCAKGLAGS